MIFIFIERYKEAAVPPALWLEQSLNAFRESLLDLCQPNRVSAHPPLERSSPQNPSSPIHDHFSSPSRSSAAQAASTKQILDNFHKLMSACVVLRIENFMLYRVTTSGKKSMPKEFISGKILFLRFAQLKGQFSTEYFGSLIYNIFRLNIFFL